MRTISVVVFSEVGDPIEINNFLGKFHTLVYLDTENNRKTVMELFTQRLERILRQLPEGAEEAVTLIVDYLDKLAACNDFDEFIACRPSKRLGHLLCPPIEITDVIVG